jgi:carbonic anhydrase/acetyltransferase-like protein (isoleucine patch superfamily)
VLAAGAVLREGQAVPAGVMAAGVPAEVKGEVTGEAERWVDRPARSYQHLAREYRAGLRCS